MFKDENVSKHNESDELYTSEMEMIDLNHKKLENTIKKNQEDIHECNELNGWKNIFFNVSPQKFTGKGTINFISETTPEALFDLVFCEKIFEYAVKQTNKAMWKRGIKDSFTTINELRTFVGILIYMGVCSLPNTSLYWKQKNNTFYQPILANIMKYSRFKTLLAHFKLTSNVPDQAKNKNHLKTKKIISFLNKRFMKLYTPEQNLTIDEGTLPFKGRLNCKVFNPNKPHKWGIRFYFLGESSSGFVLNMIMHSEIKNNIKDIVEN